MNLLLRPLARLAVALFGSLHCTPQSTATVDVTRLPDLQIARAVHTLTTMPDGGILVVGGFSDTNQRPVAETEIFDPTPRTFKMAGLLRDARYGHTASLLPNGSVLVAGGWDARGNPVATTEVFDLKQNTFRPAASLPGPRAGHLATLLRDGRILLTGGVGARGEILASAEIYDPVTGRFSATGAMRGGRENHAATLLADGRVLVTGGHAGRGAALNIQSDAEIFDPSSSTFSPTGSLSVPRHKHDAVLLADGRVLITGGASRGDDRIASTEFYQPATDSFVPGPPMRQKRFKHFGTSLLLPDGTVLILGGASSAERYLPSDDRFETVTSLDLRHSESFAAATRGADGSILLAGGYDNAIRASAAAWLILPPSKPNREKTSLPKSP